MKLEIGKRILRAIYDKDQELYELIEKHTSYPSEEDYKDSQDYDDAVDRAEIRCLIDELKNEKNSVPPASQSIKRR